MRTRLVLFVACMVGGLAATSGVGHPTDMAPSQDGRFLYVRVQARNEIAALSVAPDGRLTPLSAVASTPAGAAGLAGF